MRWHALCLAMALLLLWARAGQAAQLYGGRGEDVLLEMTDADGGLFAVGTTSSTDGDLSVRTRSGETGWAILLAEDGGRVWSYCSAHKGMTRMVSPARTDGGYALVLTDEDGQRGEWILLGEDGRVDLRVELPDAKELCPDGRTHHVEGFFPLGGEAPAIAVILSHEDGGAMTLARVGKDGQVHSAVSFSAGAQGCAAMDGDGHIAWLNAQDGRLLATWFEEEFTPEQECVAPEGVSLLRVTDALMQEDGSITLCGEGERDGARVGLALRVNRAGELLFLLELEPGARHLCQTETGFAVCVTDGERSVLVFLDEDGRLLETSESFPAEALDLAAAPGGAAMLTREGEAARRQAAVTRVLQGRTAAQEEPEPMQEPVSEPEAGKTPMPQAETDEAESALRTEEGFLVCREEPGSVTVACMDGDGLKKWQTRIPIHTAADALEWRCAARLTDGSVLLGGRYMTGTGDEARQTGALALLDGDGVLRRMHTLEEVGCVSAMEMQEDGRVALHVASGTGIDDQADEVLLYTP